MTDHTLFVVAAYCVALGVMSVLALAIWWGWHRSRQQVQSRPSLSTQARAGGLEPAPVPRLRPAQTTDETASARHG